MDYFLNKIPWINWSNVVLRNILQSIQLEQAIKLFGAIHKRSCWAKSSTPLTSFECNATRRHSYMKATAFHFNSMVRLPFKARSRELFRHGKTPRLLILKAVFIVECSRRRLYRHCFPGYNNITRPRGCHERTGPTNRLMFAQGYLTHTALQSTIPFHFAKGLLRVRALLKLSQSTTKWPQFRCNILDGEVRPELPGDVWGSGLLL